MKVLSSEKRKKKINILLIVDAVDEVAPLRSQLESIEGFVFALKSTTKFREALHLINNSSFDLILLDVSTFRGSHFDLFVAIEEQADDIPIVVITSQDDEQVAIRAVEEGAQDYIVKGHVNTRHLVHSLKYAVLRQKLLQKLVDQSLMDELTGLYNRRGFLTLGEQQLRVIDRNERGIELFFIDLDGMKQINDLHGHATGDKALVATAELFRHCFRKSDILARIGGDEFAVLAIETPVEKENILLERLRNQISHYNNESKEVFQLSLSIGTAHYDPESHHSLSDLMDQADAAMYEDKKTKKNIRL